jgi:hypothetical protein
MTSNFNIDKFLFTKLTADIGIAQQEATVLALKLQLKEQEEEKSASGAILKPATGPVAKIALPINRVIEPSVQSQSFSLALNSSKATYAQVLKSPPRSSKALASITESEFISISLNKDNTNIILALQPQFIHSNILALSLYHSKSSMISAASTIPSHALSTITTGSPTSVFSANNDYKVVKALSKPSEATSPNVKELGSSDTFSGMCL